MFKDGAVVLDVGINRDENNKLCGDVDFDDVKDKVSAITPVPGGIGPMTITMLMKKIQLKLFIIEMVTNMEYKLNDIVEMKKGSSMQKSQHNGKLLEWVQILKLNVWDAERL